MTLMNPGSVPDSIKDEINRMADGFVNTIPEVSKVSYLSRGGSARVLSYESKEGNRATKILADARIDFQDSVNDFIREYEIVKKFDDIPGIIQVYDFGNLNNSLKNPFYTMEYSGLGPIRKFVKDISSAFQPELEFHGRYENPSEWIYQTVRSVLEALAHIHKKGYCHLDVKEQNILLFTDEKKIIPKLHDFGSAQEISESDSEKEIQVTYLYAPKEWQGRSEIKSASSHQRVSLKVQAKQIMPWVDLHMVGVMLRQLLRDDTVYDGFRIHLDRADVEIMLAFADALGQESRLPSGQRLNDASKAVKHLEAGMESDLRVEKLIGLGNKPHTIVPLTFYSNKINDLVHTQLFQRLLHIPQLSITRNVFDNANHSRYEHSLGVFQNACDMLNVLLSKTGSPWLRIFAQEKDIKETLAAALVHDLGQYPFAHYLEGKYPFKVHAELTEEMLRGTDDAKRLFGNDKISEFHKSLEKNIGVDPYDVADLLQIARTGEILDRERDPLQHALGTVLDGPLDADKIDYLTRDAHHCAVPYGKLINRDSLVNHFIINTSALKAGTIERFVLSVKEPARIAAELVAVARYSMFTSVYLHEDVRAFAAIVMRALVIGFRTIIMNMSKNESNEILAGFTSVGEDAALNYIIEKMKALNMPELEIPLSLLETLKSNIKYLLFAEIRGDEELVYEGIENYFALGKEKDNLEIECNRYLEGEKRIREAASEIIGIELKEKDLIIDVPSRSWDKSREFKRMAVIDQFGRTNPVGNLWEAILDKVQAWVWKARVFISPDYGHLISESRAERMRDKLVDIFTQA